MRVLVLALAAVALGMLTQLAPLIATVRSSALSPLPSYRGNVTGHSRLT